MWRTVVVPLYLRESGELFFRFLESIVSLLLPGNDHCFPCGMTTKQIGDSAAFNRCGKVFVPDFRRPLFPILPENADTCGLRRGERVFPAEPSDRAEVGGMNLAGGGSPFSSRRFVFDQCLQLFDMEVRNNGTYCGPQGFPCARDTATLCDTISSHDGVTDDLVRQFVSRCRRKVADRLGRAIQMCAVRLPIIDGGCVAESFFQPFQGVEGLRSTFDILLGGIGLQEPLERIDQPDRSCQGVREIVHFAPPSVPNSHS